MNWPRLRATRSFFDSRANKALSQDAELGKNQRCRGGGLNFLPFGTLLKKGPPPTCPSGMPHLQLRLRGRRWTQSPLRTWQRPRWGSYFADDSWTVLWQSCSMQPTSPISGEASTYESHWLVGEEAVSPQRFTLPGLHTVCGRAAKAFDGSLPWMACVDEMQGGGHFGITAVWS